MKYALCIFLLFGGLFVFSQEVKKIKVKKEAVIKRDTCSAALLGIPGGYISKNKLQFCEKLETVVCIYKIESFVISYAGKAGKPALLSPSKDEFFTREGRAVLQSLGLGNKFYITDIKAKDPVTGKDVSLPSLTFKVN